MPSDNEVKQIMTEKVFPFFDGNGLKDILSRLEAIEELTVQRKEEERIRTEAVNKEIETEKAKEKTTKTEYDFKASVGFDNSRRAKVVKKAKTKK